MVTLVGTTFTKHRTITNFDEGLFTSTMAKDSNIATLKESLDVIVRNLDSHKNKNNDIKAAVTKIYAILSESDIEVERLYLTYQICNRCADNKKIKVDKLIKSLLPPPLTPAGCTLISQLIGLSLCYPMHYSNILDTLSPYLDSSETITIDTESWDQSTNLAKESPIFCSAIISRSGLTSMNLSKKLLARWLQDLALYPEDSNFCSQHYPSLNQVIRYSLFHSRPVDDQTPNDIRQAQLENSDLHLAILTTIQYKKCQSLSNQFLIDVASTLINKQPDKQDTDSPISLVDRFAQIVSTASASRVTNVTNALRNSLTKLNSNPLINNIIQVSNKT